MLGQKYFIYLEIKNHNSRLHLNKKENQRQMKKKTGQNLRSATKAILHGKHTMIRFHCENTKKEECNINLEIKQKL